MDLSQNTPENIAYMIDSIKTKLRMASGAAMTAERFDAGQYEDLRDLYDHVHSKATFSVSEIDAIVSELGKLRR